MVSLRHEVNVAPSGKTQTVFAAGCLAVAVFATWPLLPQLFTHLPLGTLDNATVPYFNLWTLAWNVDRFGHGFVGYWDAPFFFPERHSLAMCDPQALTGLWFGLFRALVGPIAAYNITLLSLLAANGLAAQRLFRLCGVPYVAASCAALLAVATSFVQKELGVLQLAALFPVWLALSELRLLVVWAAPAPAAPELSPSATSASHDAPASIDAGHALVRLALWLGVMLWTCSQYALLFSAPLALSLPFWALGYARAGSRRAAGVALALALLTSAPIMLTQRAALRSHARSAQTVLHGSAAASDYVRPLARSLDATLLPAARRGAGRALFWGFATLGLALLGGAASLRERLQLTAAARRWLSFCALALALSVLASAGRRLQLLGVSPYAWLLERAWPGMAQLRSPYRFAALATLFGELFAAYGLGVLWRSDKRLALPLMAALSLLGIVEAKSWPTKLQRFPSEALHAPFVTWLAAHQGGAVGMVPAADSSKASAFEPTALAMLQGLEHGHPLVNGYASFFPRQSDRLAAELRHFPDPRALHKLRAAGTRYLVVNRAWLDAQTRAGRVDEPAAQALATLPRPFTSDEADIYELQARVASTVASARR